MLEYLNLVQHVLETGSLKNNRTGTDTLSTFGTHYRVDLSKGYPLLTTKKVFFNSVIRELLWYLSGQTHIRDLRKLYLDIESTLGKNNIDEFLSIFKTQNKREKNFFKNY